MDESPSPLRIVGKILKIWWVIFFSVSIAINSFSDLSWIEAYANINWSLLGLEAIGIVLVLLFAYGLYRIQPKVMGFGLLSLFKGSPTNVALIGTDIKYVGIVVCLLILTALPRWAMMEEEWFRQGTTDWWDGILRSLAFGLIHMVVGVPVVGAIAISIVGLFFTQMYFVGGVELSAQAHFQYNLILISVLLLAAILRCFVKDSKAENRRGI